MGSEGGESGSVFDYCVGVGLYVYYLFIFGTEYLLRFGVVLDFWEIVVKKVEVKFLFSLSYVF